MSFKKFRTIPGWNFCEYLGLRVLVSLLNALPIETSTWIARWAGDFLFCALPHRRKKTLANVNLAFDTSITEKQKTHIARESFRNLATSLMEFFRIPILLKSSPERFEFYGTEHLDQAFAKGKGVIFVISHLGSWEYLAFLPYLRGYPCSVVVRPTKNPYIFPWIQSLREQTKLQPIDRNQSSKEILKRLKKNELVAILIDQWAGNHGIWVDFFKTETSTTSIPFRLAERTGAALIPGYCLRKSSGKYRITIRPEVPIPSIENKEEREREVTKRLNLLLEAEIRNHPDQWTWGHNRWKAPRPKEL